MNNAIRVIAYRGEHGEPDGRDKFQTRLGSLSFSSIEAAKTYASSPNNRRDQVKLPRVIKAEIEILNPIFNNGEDPFVDFDILRPVIGDQRLTELARDLEPHLLNTDNFLTILDKHQCETLDQLLAKAGTDILDDLYVDAYPIFDESKYIDWFREAGYDGAVHRGAGATMDDVEYKIFSPDQAKVLHVTPLRPSPTMSLEK